MRWAAVALLALRMTRPAAAQESVRLMPGERPPAWGWVMAAGGLPMRAYSGEVDAFRLFPAAEFGMGLNFSAKQGAGFFARVSDNDLAGPLRAPMGFAALVWQRHGRRENDSWGGGPAWRRWRTGSNRPGERGWTALYRKDFLDYPFVYAITSDLTCFPGQCSVGLGFGAGFYF